MANIESIIATLTSLSNNEEYKVDEHVSVIKTSDQLYIFRINGKEYGPISERAASYIVQKYLAGQINDPEIVFVIFSREALSLLTIMAVLLAYIKYYCNHYYILYVDK